MASVTSLDKDLRKMRLEKYTPAAAAEARAWVEDILGEKLPSSDLLEGLKDGVALCRLVNLVLPPPGVKFKKSAMPFVQMENISHFLRACQTQPLGLHQHDMFLTVDLFEQKDPAQVLQCLGAFSRAAHALAPDNFPTTIGPRPRTAGGLSPQATGPVTPDQARHRGASLASNGSSAAYGSCVPSLSVCTADSASGRWSPTKSRPKSPSNGGGSPGLVSSWSRKDQEAATAPAWNISQYGYMGGASQGNLGISFGGRRQITGAGPKVPSLVEKERLRKEAEERNRQEAQDSQRRRIADEEEEARREEERRWEEETERLRQEERRKAEEEQREWDEQERQWQLTEQKRRQEEREAQARLDEERQRVRGRNDCRLRGQFLSQFRAEQQDGDDDHVSEAGSRVKQLEKELALAREREAEYERERLSRSGAGSRTASDRPPKPRVDSWSRDEREVLHTPPSNGKEKKKKKMLVSSPRPLPDPAPSSSSPCSILSSPKVRSPPNSSSSSSRPLPEPKRLSFSPSSRTTTTTTATTATTSTTATTAPSTIGRHQPASKSSLLEREMELERQRQREWEEAQHETAKAARSSDGVDGIGGRWDVGQWAGYTGGDSQNRGSHGIGAGRRQIVGPRPLPGAGGH
ncbi:hypothetical protein L249_2158 [Ophiocordyceps polyrhachis-furcata BCC 54312]|uniref:Calponin-homology (CH) domain-containing protein n=1 Tax=Ophiocordyceps polyrhachis-furcata BCC 54312 TaxID=1330021 RepID=A0A367LPI7_9HYPO|nr:hypothetical protein L249_2158 [Ophiocordyceps polyrhachis-furcata BCC 54312]